MKYNSHDLLEHLNLDDYFISLNFKYLPKESSIRWKKYLNPADNCKYLVGRNSQNNQWIYKNTNEENKFNNIFHFEKKYNKNISNFLGTEKEKNYLLIEKLNKFLDPSFQKEFKKTENVLKFTRKIKEKKSLSDSSEFNRVPFKDYTYLVEQRKINKKTVDHPIIKPTVFNTIFQFNSGHQNINTAFAKFDDNNNIHSMEVYYETKYESKSLVSGNKNIENYDQYLWHSVIDKSKSLSHVFFSESAKDALSYFDILLNTPTAEKNNFNPLFISIAGNLDRKNLKKQQLISIIEKKANIDKNTSFISISDNDKVGNLYDIHFLETSY
uniref:hypothetical protein n=1 Tax=Tenacibaculum ovolyticum TaxID=104270 RepID=UPI0009ECF414